MLEKATVMGRLFVVYMRNKLYLCSMEEINKLDVIGLSLITIVNAIKFVTDVDIRIDTRKREIVSLKKIYYKIAKERTKCAAQKMANFVKTKNHATALYHIGTADDMLKQFPKYQKIYDEVLELVVNTKQEKIEESGNKITHFVDRVVQVKKHIEYVDKPVDVYDTGIPRHIIDHLAEYSEDELNHIFETRLKPYRVFHNLNKVNESKKVKLEKQHYV